MPVTAAAAALTWVLIVLLFSSASGVLHRRILHHPFFPVDFFPPTGSPALSPPAPDKYPFPVSTPNNNYPFFPSYPSPPPPSPASLAIFPANFSSVSVNPSLRYNTVSSKLITAAIAAVIAAVSIVSLAVFLHLRRPTGDSRRPSFANKSTSQRSHENGVSPFNNTNRIPKLQRPSQTSAEFLYLGTLVNAHAVGIGGTFDGGSSGPSNQSRVFDTPVQASPELRPLRSQHIFWKKFGDSEESSKDDWSEEFHSPKSSSNGGNNFTRPVSISERDFAGLVVTPVHSSPVYSSSVSGFVWSPPLRSVSVPILTLSPSRQTPPPLGSFPVSSSPSPPCSSPEIYSRRSRESSTRIFDSSKQNEEYFIPATPDLESTVSESTSLPGSPFPKEYSRTLRNSGNFDRSTTKKYLIEESSSRILTTNWPENTGNIPTPSRPPPPPPIPPPSLSTVRENPPEVTTSSTSRSISIENQPLISALELPSSASVTGEKHEEQKQVGESFNKTKLKPLHWDKVRASSDREMVWDQLRCSSFKLDEEMIETLFVLNNPKPNPKEATRWQVLPSPNQDNGRRVLDPKKSQNIAILLRALHVTADEVCEGLLQGNTDILAAELLESLLKMAPTKEEEQKLKECRDDSPLKLGAAEKFLKAVVNIPFAFKRVEILLYISNFDSEVEHLKNSFAALEAACEELRTSRMFLKLLEAVLKTGNRMNVGTNRGDAHAFKLDTLLKLVDVKGADGKTTLLHFVVQEIIRTEGADGQKPNDDVKFRKLGLQVVSALSLELSNVKKAAVMDAEGLARDVTNLGEGLKTVGDVSSRVNLEGNGFSEAVNSFTERAAEEILKIQAEERVALSLVKEITEYFHGNSVKEEAHPFRIFTVVRDFLSILDRVCEEVGSVYDRTTISSIHKFPVPVNPLLVHQGG